MVALLWSWWCWGMARHQRSRRTGRCRSGRTVGMPESAHGRHRLASTCLVCEWAYCWYLPSKWICLWLCRWARLWPTQRAARLGNLQTGCMGVASSQDCRRDRSSYRCSGSSIVFMQMWYHSSRKRVGHWWWPWQSTAYCCCSRPV